jgi:hypothetical protein
LTDISTLSRPSRRQSAHVLQASRSTHSPIDTISPLSSASGMNWPGGTSPMLRAVPAQQRLDGADPLPSPATSCGW